MVGAVEVVDVEVAADLAHAGVVAQDRAQHAALGLKVLRRQPLGQQLARRLLRGPPGARFFLTRLEHPPPPCALLIRHILEQPWCIGCSRAVRDYLGGSVALPAVGTTHTFTSQLTSA